MGHEISIQQLLGNVDEVVRHMGHAELCKLVRELAEAQPVEERAGFLESLLALKGGRKGSPDTKWNDAGELVECIKEIRAEAEERLGHIENGDYEMLDDFDYEDYGGWHGDEPDVLSQDLCDSLGEVEKQASHFLLDGEFGKAFVVYHELILFEHHARRAFYGSALPDAKTMGENHCRCAYGLASADSRPKALFDAVSFVAEHLDFPCKIFSGRGIVLLGGLMDLEFDDAFFKEWEAFLSPRQDELALVLHVEALLMADRRDEALLRLKGHGEAHAMAWLLYLHELEAASQWECLAEGCRLVLAFLHERKDRRDHVAGLLQKAGIGLGKMDDIAEGTRERFFLSPSLWYLSVLFSEVRGEETRREELAVYDRFLAKREFGGVHAAVKLLRGKLDEVLALCGDIKPLGWSYGTAPDPVAVCGGLVALCGGGETLPPNLSDMLDRYLDIRSFPFPAPISENTGTRKQCLKDSLRVALSALELEDGEKGALLERLRRAVVERADSIIHRQHRKAYGRAAEGLVAWAEVASLNGKAEDARKLLHGFHEQYKRHRAFRRELDTRAE